RRKPTGSAAETVPAALTGHCSVFVPNSFRPELRGQAKNPPGSFGPGNGRESAYLAAGAVGVAVSQAGWNSAAGASARVARVTSSRARRPPGVNTSMKLGTRIAPNAAVGPKRYS